MCFLCLSSIISMFYHIFQQGYEEETNVKIEVKRVESDNHIILLDCFGKLVE